MYIFARVHKDGTTIRVRPMAGQTMADGSAVRILNVSCDKSCRPFLNDSDPVVFLAQDFRSAGALSGEYYEGGDIYIPETSTYFEGQSSPKVKKMTADMWKKFRNFTSTTSPTPANTKRSFSYLDKMMNNQKFAPPTIDKEGFYVDTDIWYYLLRNIRKGVPSLIVGETGTGKTELVDFLSKAVGLPLNKIDMGTIIDAQSGLLGTHKFKNGSSVIDMAPFTKFIQGPGVVLFDEINRAPLGSSNILLPPLDGGKKLSVEISEDARVIEVHEDCCFVATANIGVKYTATKTIDRALLDRFRKVELPQLSPDIEARLYQKRSFVDVMDAGRIANIIGSIRQEYIKGEISETVSIRYGFDVASLVADGYDVETAFRLAVLPLFENDGTDSERSAVLKIITSK